MYHGLRPGGELPTSSPHLAASEFTHRAAQEQGGFTCKPNCEGEWRAYFMSSPMFAPAGFGVAPTPWEAVQRAGWAAVGHAPD